MRYVNNQTPPNTIPTTPQDETSEESDSPTVKADTSSDTTSLRSCIWDYPYENGRRYNAYRFGEYWSPNDEQQAEQLDICHHLCNLTLDGQLFLAPIGDQPQRVLDVGTGTGLWAMAFADAFPSADVIGTDLSPIQPRAVPANLRFEVDDCTQPWTYAPESFDYIHVRCLYGSVADWPAFYAECFKALKPGGLIEQLEVSLAPQSEDGTLPRTSALTTWSKLLLAAGDAAGKSLRTVDEMAQHIRSAGFAAATQRRWKWPIGGWMARPAGLRARGVWNRLQWEAGLEGWSLLLLTRWLGWSKGEVGVLMRRVRAALRDRRVHAYQDVAVVYARKPDNRLAN
ncbi:SAM dependent methyltransferase [Phyllosticta citrichinensis]|uniref:SAM dependent methyltransferase n=1 Tax=Phyllosticta citrichinensis TaxID=1130410 RepID=A0ABR1Y5X8_9PEZI